MNMVGGDNEKVDTIKKVFIGTIVMMLKPNES